VNCIVFIIRSFFASRALPDMGYPTHPRIGIKRIKGAKVPGSSSLPLACARLNSRVPRDQRPRGAMARLLLWVLAP